ncbi:MAG: ribonuclease III [Gammaproteobacteria bacterium]|nr:ribonuclease III [Gammaproteobacteria bacterium]
MTSPLSALCRELGYRFTETRLLEDALTHRSAGGANYERLEFLGDAVLNFVIAAELYQRYPQAMEGDLSRLRASLVRRETLAQIAHSLRLGAYLTLGYGEKKSGGHRRESTLEDALEAVIGAIYLDGGLEPCRKVLQALYQARLSEMPEAVTLKDPKTRLQEYLQSRKMPPPQYSVVQVSGEAHAQTFRIECSAPGLQPTQGVGSSRRKAEQDAAQKALELLERG